MTPFYRAALDCGPMMLKLILPFSVALGGDRFSCFGFRGWFDTLA
jgi:hypothetical protein